MTNMTKTDQISPKDTSGIHVGTFEPPRTTFAALWTARRSKILYAALAVVLAGGITTTVLLMSHHSTQKPSTNGKHVAPNGSQSQGSATGPSAQASGMPAQGSDTTATNKPATPTATKGAATNSPTGNAGSGSGGGGSTGGGGSSPPQTTSYVQPGTQGYRGSLTALTVYSAANGQVPPGTDCSWNQTYKYMRCNDASLTLDHVYIQGGLYWTGCDSLTLTNSIFDWYPSQTWFDVDNACASPNAGSTITASYATFETSPSVIHYTGGSDIGGIYEYTGDVPMHVSHSLIQGFSQGLDPGGGSIIESSEIYVQDNTCSGNLICHGDGLFSQGGNNITYENNYIVAASDATSAIFYQSSPNSSGNKVLGNYLQGGSYALYNENSNGVDVENNTFGGSTYGNCSLQSGATWGTWSGNVTTSGTAVVPESNGGCS